VETLFAPVVVAGVGVTRGVEEVRSAVPVPLDTTGEVDGLVATLPAPVEVPEPKVVVGVEATEELTKALVEVPKPKVVAGVEATEELAEALVEIIDAGLLVEGLAALVGKAVSA
jgi:hypothetical protein